MINAKRFNGTVDSVEVIRLKPGNEDYGILTIKSANWHTKYLDRANTKALIDALQAELDAAGPESIAMPEGTVRLVDVDGDNWYLADGGTFHIDAPSPNNRGESLETIVRLYGPVECLWR